jgi:hypothetical protein
MLGVGDKQGDLLDDVARFCEEALSERSIYGFLRCERDQLVPEEACCDLFKDCEGVALFFVRWWPW